ncbi:MAG: hypothetical protein H6698_00030 [Myxococcales bacterium]|nr:hypothetical protein [Myxococcales bacterium]MCB9520555.1 hypothetical protein [Myxococcales bacterium]MCB9532598.1 hypothetical protein [Myxococcales bacterium]MCB9532699.1 hypothetical protein [Myxococcales bacterium]
MLLDLHAYTQLTGGPTLDAVVDGARSRGLDAACVVDRERSAATAAAAVSGAYGFPLLVGVELPTRTGDVLLFVSDLDPVMTREEWRELTALGVPELSTVVAFAAANDGVVLLSHPYDRNRRAAPRDRMFALGGVAGVELGTDAADERANRVALEAVAKSALPGFGGTARRGGAQAPGWLTLFGRPVATQADLVAALRSGDFWAVQVQGRSRGAAA